MRERIGCDSRVQPARAEFANGLCHDLLRISGTPWHRKHLYAVWTKYGAPTTASTSKLGGSAGVRVQCAVLLPSKSTRIALTSISFWLLATHRYISTLTDNWQASFLLAADMGKQNGIHGEANSGKPELELWNMMEQT